MHPIAQTYKGKQCQFDGTRTRYADTRKCVECEAYRKAVMAGKAERHELVTEKHNLLAKLQIRVERLERIITLNGDSE